MERRILTILLAIITVYYVSSAAAKVSDTDCTSTKCPANAECNNAVNPPKCKCSVGYKEGGGDGSTCIKMKVSEVECTKDAVDQCEYTPNAECNNEDSDAKCKCSDGFVEEKTNGYTCVKILGGNCPSTVTCADTGYKCSDVGKCICSNDYGEKNNICVLTVEGAPCTDGGDECKSIKNSQCDNLKCKCDAGYVMDVNVCTADSAAPMVQFGWMTILLGVLTIALPLF